MSDTHFMVVHNRSQVVSGVKVGFEQYGVRGQRRVGIFQLSKHQVGSRGPLRKVTVLQVQPSDAAAPKKRDLAHIQPNNRLFSSTDLSRDLFVRQVETGLIVGRVRSRPRQPLSCSSELIRRAKAPIRVA
jgi:hypothetical protein